MKCLLYFHLENRHQLPQRCGEKKSCQFYGKGHNLHYEIVASSLHIYLMISSLAFCRKYISHRVNIRTMLSIQESSKGPIEEELLSKLTSSLQPSVMKIVNESYKHNVPKGSESHFKVFIVSEKFEGLTPLQRHRLVNSAVADTITKIHAFSIETRSPLQYAKDESITETPNCLGGSKK